jgi:hypothetical protein
MARFASGALKVFLVVGLGAGALGACQEEPALGSFAEPCNTDEQCRGSMTCDVIDVASRKGQCSRGCTSDAQCTSDFPGSRCYQGATAALDGGSASGGRCVLTCQSSDECPGITQCNNLGWCSHSATIGTTPATGGTGGAGTGGAAGTAGAGGDGPDAGGTGGTADSGVLDAGGAGAGGATGSDASSDASTD